MAIEGSSKTGTSPTRRAATKPRGRRRLIATDNLRVVPRALRLGRATHSTIRQDLLWAFAYTVGIPPAALGLFDPLIAAPALSLSSVTVEARSSLPARLRLDPG